MTASSLFASALDNRGLFSDHYLTDRFPNRDDVQALQPEADAAFEEVRTLYRRIASEADTWNEAQTEDNVVQPILSDILGWSRKVQARVQKQGRVGRLATERDGTTVHVRATARFKPCSESESRTNPEPDSGPAGERNGWPDAVPDDAEPDRWGYVETEPLPVCTLHDCSEREAGLIVHWLDALNDADRGFSGYRDTATKTIPLLDRLYDLRFPDPDRRRDALRSFLDNAQAAADLDRQIAFTDGLIDRIVYRLYDLSDEEVAVVEGT